MCYLNSLHTVDPNDPFFPWSFFIAVTCVDAFIL